MKQSFFGAVNARFVRFGLAVATALVAGDLAAQEVDVVSRFPDQGIAILDCQPALPAPENSCVLRVPPDQLRGRIRSAQVGDEDADFDFAAPDDRRLGEGIALSETIILVDLTPGPNGQRRGTFAQEKRLIRQFVETLPDEGRFAVYGFNEELIRLLDFTTSRQSVLEAVDALTLSGTNTRISTYTKDVVDILAERNSAILKRVFVISDGEEEGTGDIAAVTEAAIASNVSISAIGTFWRAVGSREIAAGRDFLRSLTEPTLGSSVEVLLQRQDEAREKIVEFSNIVKSSIEGSGLILPDGPVRAADIIVTLKVPETGVAGSYRDEEVKVRFTPLADEGTADEVTSDEPVIVEEDMLFGYPAMWVYGAFAGLGLLLLLLLFALFKGKRGTQNDELDNLDNFEEGFDGFDDNGGNNDSTRVVAPITPPEDRPSAYLVEVKSNRRLPISGVRVSIGRGTANSMIIDHDSISRVHAEIVRNRDGGYTLADSDSLNGTFINSKRIAGTKPIHPGDEIKLGEVSLRLVLA